MIRGCVTFLCLIVFFLGFFGEVTSGETHRLAWTDLKSQATLLYVQNDSLGAIQAFSKAISAGKAENAPLSSIVEMESQRAAIFISLERFADAEEALDFVLSHENGIQAPNTVEAMRSARGVARSRQGKFVAALEDLGDGAGQTDGQVEHTDVRWSRGDALLYTGECGPAYVQFRKAIEKLDSYDHEVEADLLVGGAKACACTGRVWCSATLTLRAGSQALADQDESLDNIILHFEDDEDEDDMEPFTWESFLERVENKLVLMWQRKQAERIALWLVWIVIVDCALYYILWPLKVASGVSTGTRWLSLQASEALHSLTLIFLLVLICGVILSSLKNAVYACCVRQHLRESNSAYGKWKKQKQQ